MTETLPSMATAEGRRAWLNALVPPPKHDGETDGSWTHRIAGEGARQGKRRQCSIGWHEECSDPEGLECRCVCHMDGRPSTLMLAQWLAVVWDEADAAAVRIEALEAARGASVTAPTGGDYAEAAAVAAALLTAAVVHTPEFSAGKWRVKTDDGRTLTYWTEYPDSAQPRGGGVPGFQTPLCAETKRDVDRLLTAARSVAARRLLEAINSANEPPGLDNDEDIRRAGFTAYDGCQHALCPTPFLCSERGDCPPDRPMTP